jgi:hypothetical protein
MELSRELLLLVAASLIIGFAVGFINQQSQINSINNEILTLQNSLNEKNSLVNQLEDQVLLYTTQIERMNLDIEKYESEINSLKDNYENLERDYNDIIKLYNNLYFLESSFNTVDFSNYSEVDPDNKIQVNKSRIYWKDMDRGTYRRVYKEYEKGYFSDFKHLIDFKFDIIDPGDPDVRTIIELWSLCNEERRDDNSNYITLSAVQIGINPNIYKISFSQRSRGESKFSFLQLGNLESGTTYYVTISRRDNLCQLEIFSDPERNNIVLDTGLLLGSDAKYTYLNLAKIEEHVGDFFDTSSGYIENLRIKTY